ncbi:MAG TPA: amino acid--tRNA ligase-related protein, partial [Candidatus Nanoarchaeia archaeon]|nr:amino acid--tRNA ligase-related protein [Candidatus Nanoarchaeia archaeon]
MEPENVLVQERLNKLKEIKALGVNPYPYNYNRTHHAEHVKTTFAHLQAQEHTEEVVSIAGRIVLKRDMGKASFLTIADQTGTLQCYAREDILGEQYKVFKKLDLGDIIGVKGTIFRTKMGEITVEAKELTLLTKTLRPLPDKFHGIQDLEIKYRQRYTDFATNKESRDAVVVKSRVISEMRKILEEKGFIEVETPILQPQYGGANARPFVTHHNSLNFDMYLKVSPELYLKRLVVGGFEKVFEIGKNFRNEGIDHTHNPEFTMMELYQAYADYNTMMELTEELYERIALKLLGTTQVRMGTHVIELKRPWRRLTMIDAIKEYTNIGDITKLDDSEIKDLLRTYNVKYDGEYIKG